MNPKETGDNTQGEVKAGSPYRIPAGQEMPEPEETAPADPVIGVGTWVRHRLEDLYDRVGDAGTSIRRMSPFSPLREVTGILAQIFTSGQYRYDPNPPTRVERRESDRHDERWQRREKSKKGVDVK